MSTGYGGAGIIEAPTVSRNLAMYIMSGQSSPLLGEWAFQRFPEATK